MELYRRKQQEVQDAKDAEQDSKLTTYWQKKTLSSNITSGTGVSTALSFNNLEIGKKYRLTVQANMDEGGVSDASYVYLNFTNNSIDIVNLALTIPAPPSGAQGVVRAGSSDIFIAGATTVLANYQVNSSGVIYQDKTFAILEEVPNHVETTQWT